MDTQLVSITLLKNNEIKIGKDVYYDCTFSPPKKIKPIIQKILSPQEKTAYRLGCLKVKSTGDDIEIDQVKYQSIRSTELDNVYSKKISEISSKTTDIAIKKGFIHNNSKFSTSSMAQMNLGNLVNMDNIGLIDWINPYPYSTGDHKGDYLIQDRTELHAMASQMAQVITPILRAGALLEKQITDIVEATKSQNPTKTVDEAIAEIENFVDTR